MATTILGDEARKKLELVPLSNNVLPCRIPDLSLDVLEKVISHMKASPLKPPSNLTRLPMCFKLLSSYCTG